MTPAEYKAGVENELKIRVFEIVEGLVNGGGEEPGIGERTDIGISMTAATECYWGMSGRGNPNAKAKIRAAANLGYVRVEKRGRNERVGITDKGLELYRAMKNEKEKG